MPKETVEALVDGGKASAAPPLGPSLAQLKVSVGDVVSQINERTKSFSGMQVPVKVIVDTGTKKFDIVVGSPPVSALIKKEMGAEKLAHVSEDKMKLPGDISLESIIKIAKSKDIPGDLRARVKQVLGTCLSGGVMVEGRSPKDVIREIDEGVTKVE